MADECAADGEEGFVDVVAAVVAAVEASVGCSQEIVRSTTQRSLPSPEPWLVPRLAIRGVMPRSRSALRCLAAVICAVGEQRLWPELAVSGRSVGPDRRAGISSVMSWRLPAVSVTAKGMPWPSQITWCLEPARRRSTGEGPVFSPPLWLARASCPPPPLTSRALPRPAVRPRALGAGVPRPQLRSSPVAVASTSSPTRTPSLAADAPTGCRSSRTNRIPVSACPVGHPLAPRISIPPLDTSATTARYAPTTHH